MLIARLKIRVVVLLVGNPGHGIDKGHGREEIVELEVTLDRGGVRAE